MLEYLTENKYKPKKIIYYTPTWRPYNYKLPLLNLKNFDLMKFNLFLKKIIFYFFTLLIQLTRHQNLKVKNSKILSI